MFECKNRWYQEKKAKSNQAVFSQGRPNVVWQDIHFICKSRASLLQAHPRAVRKQDGSLCCGSVETLGQWRHHCESVLNMENSFSWAIIDSIQPMAVREEMSNPRTGYRLLCRVLKWERRQVVMVSL